jgi:hypothetical protein
MATVLSRASRFTRRADSRSRSISSVSLTIEEKMDTADFDRRPPKEELVFGTTLSDHMLMIEWSKEKNWMDPRIIPRQDLNISPAASSLHYGTLFFSQKPQCPSRAMNESLSSRYQNLRQVYSALKE